MLLDNHALYDKTKVHNNWKQSFTHVANNLQKDSKDLYNNNNNNGSNYAHISTTQTDKCEMKLDCFSSTFQHKKF